jgi:hypothetical protein
MGHGSALHFPDHPFRFWKYTNGHGERITRDNPRDFLEAANELCKFLQCYRSNLEVDVDQGSGFPPQELQKIEQLIREFQDNDGLIRCERWLKKIAEGFFSFGSADVKYAPSGRDSWKFAALGVEEEKIGSFDVLKMQPGFASSNWKLFHEAAMAHQNEVLRHVLPEFELVVI